MNVMLAITKCVNISLLLLSASHFLVAVRAQTSCGNLNVGFDIDSSNVVRRGRVQQEFALGAPASEANAIGSDVDRTYFCASAIAGSASRCTCFAPTPTPTPPADRAVRKACDIFVCWCCADFRNADAEADDSSRRLRVSVDLQYTSPFGETLLSPHLDGELVRGTRSVTHILSAPKPCLLYTSPSPRDRG